MKRNERSKRRNEILDIAILELTERGYRDTSMLDIARRANASKETLYTWFGDKRGLLEALIVRNAALVESTLIRHAGANTPLDQALREFGEALLGMLLSDSAVAINRAAVSEAMADPSLAELLDRAGRNTVFPIFVSLLKAHSANGSLVATSATQVATDFLGLLIGDTQIRRLLGQQGEPGKRVIRARAAHATRCILLLHGQAVGE